MKTAKEYAYEYFAPDAPDELDIDIIKCIITDHDNELISEIEKKIDKLEESRSGGRLTGAALAGVNITIIRLTEIINIIKEK